MYLTTVEGDIFAELTKQVCLVQTAAYFWGCLKTKNPKQTKDKQTSSLLQTHHTLEKQVIADFNVYHVQVIFCVCKSTKQECSEPSQVSTLFN